MNVSNLARLDDDTLLDAARWHAEKLLAHGKEEVRALAAGAAGATRAFSDASGSCRNARLKAGEAAQARDAAEDSLHQVLRALAGDLRGDEPAFRSLFPAGGLAFILEGTAAACDAAASLATALRAHGGPLLAGRAPLVADKAARYRAAAAAASALRSRWLSAQDAALAAREELLRLLRASSWVLRDLLPEQEAAALFPSRDDLRPPD